MNPKILFYSILFLFFISCKKEETKPNYFVGTWDGTSVKNFSGISEDSVFYTASFNYVSVYSCYENGTFTELGSYFGNFYYYYDLDNPVVIPVSDNFSISGKYKVLDDLYFYQEVDNQKDIFSYSFSSDKKNLFVSSDSENAFSINYVKR